MFWGTHPECSLEWTKDEKYKRTGEARLWKEWQVQHTSSRHSRRENKHNEREAIFKGRMTENFPELEKDTSLQNEPHQLLSKINKNNIIFKHDFQFFKIIGLFMFSTSPNPSFWVQLA